MKKTMFITSVIMVVVMAIALTTSSLAWFSAGGKASVTTQSFKVTAFAGTSEGIAISHKDPQTSLYNWSDSLDLSTTGNTGLMPLVPFSKKTTALTSADLLAALVGGSELPYMTEAIFTEDYAKYADTDEKTVATYAAIYAAYEAESNGDPTTYEALVTAGLVSADTIGTVANTDYAAYMVGNKYDNNGMFTNNAYRSGFYTDTFYITNLATGDTLDNNDQVVHAPSINLDTVIKFKFEKWITENEGTQQEATVLKKFDYTRQLRTAALYDTDPTLCVAVLAKVSEFDTDMAEFLGVHNSAGDGWEIIAYADSKNWKGENALTTGNIAMGKNSEAFEKGATVSNCLNYVSKNGLNITNTEELRPERLYTLADADLVALRTAVNNENLALPEGKAVGDGVKLAADIKTIKVVAWYDGYSLNNSNAVNGDLMFDLEFSIAN